MNKIFIVFASLSGATAVMLGALGAHALKDQLSPERLNSFETGVKYQLFHALALFLVALFLEKKDSRSLKISGYLFLAGTLLFSGSIYLLATQQITGISFRFLGPVTPLGGISFMAGWLLVGYSFLKR